MDRGIPDPVWQMNAPELGGLSETGIEQLAARLAQITNSAALSLEGVDGLFCVREVCPMFLILVNFRSSTT
jgi:hypothetical protein